MSTDGGVAGVRRPASDSDPDGSASLGWKIGETPPHPRRYRQRELEGHSHVSCDEAPRMQVRVGRDFSFTLERARALGERVILLDGAGSFGPLIDNKAKLYNLDHHAECERVFTLATCEQALLLVQSGLDLSEGDWLVYANEPDLDTVLAIWVLLNYERVRDLRRESREILFPLLRLEGAIDANGPELAQFCGLPADALERAQAHIDELLGRERASKKSGDWQTVDFESFTIEVLNDIDRMVYSIEDFREYGSIDDIYGHVEIAERQVAVACRDSAGVYAVERLLKSRWGNQLAVIALENRPHHFTLRRTSTLATLDLEDAYGTLNLLDPAVDGRPASQRWGGSSAIGGSPRPSGTLLSPNDLLRVLADAFRPRPRWRPLIDISLGICWTAVVGTLAVTAGLVWGTLPGVVDPLRDELARVATSALVAMAAALLLAWRSSRRRMWLFGLRRPAPMPYAWLLGMGAAALAIPARAWFPLELSLDALPLAACVAAAVLAAIAVELWFRGVLHGVLQFDAKVQSPDGPWFISLACWTSAVVYAAATLLLSLPPIALSPSPLLAQPAEIAIVAGASLLAGLALGVLRERTLSLWPGVAAQVVGALANLGFWLWLANP